MASHPGPETEQKCQDSSASWINARVIPQLALAKLGAVLRQKSSSLLWQALKPKRPAAWRKLRILAHWCVQGIQRAESDQNSVGSPAPVAVGGQVCIQVLQTLGGSHAPRQQRSRRLEGVTQGDALSIFACQIGVLHLIRQFKAKFPQVEQPWYADGAKFDENEHFFQLLCEIGPLFGYYAEPTKSILIVQQHNLEEAWLQFPDVKVRRGNCYLGGFIREDEALNEWLGEKTKFWTEAVNDLTLITQAFPQGTYPGLQNSLQQEWQFVQRVTKGIDPEFASID
jgi:hypothetical protein